ncbi:MarR family winged helix-turn-helix transcriptional regulator [Martelella endophytica]|uniref:MarR family transcriptional regulator n=1 Tax=Martelella endophytica TaxID=1486262 RepID=A0A0D5LUU6_MAREN|nr:MarR family transcriptional regulator [Martelella endophytica]AJY48019.1 MarR family transcriptional regulator [Martelella endophytica]
MNAPKSNPPVALDKQVCFAVHTASMAIQRLYKPLLDELELTYPQYLVLNVLWLESPLTVGAIASRLALESSTVTPLLKRLEAAELLHRVRNPDNERQVLIKLTDRGRALRGRAGCLGDALLEASGKSAEELARLNSEITELRNRIYERIGTWEQRL